MKKLLILLALPLLFAGCATQDTKMSATNRQDTYRQASDENRMSSSKDYASTPAYDIVPQ